MRMGGLREVVPQLNITKTSLLDHTNHNHVYKTSNYGAHFSTDIVHHRQQRPPDGSHGIRRALLLSVMQRIQHDRSTLVSLLLNGTEKQKGKR